MQREEYQVGERVELNPEPDEPVNDFRIDEIHENGDVQMYNIFNGQGYYIPGNLVSTAMRKINK